MRRAKVKKENPPVRLLGTMFLLVLGLVVVYVVLRQGEGAAHVSISDTGVGMDEETQRHIFEKFYCAATSSGDRGNGLGLSIVQRVVKLCGGQITVFSRPGKGSTFTVTLPAEQL